MPCRVVSFVVGNFFSFLFTKWLQKPFQLLLSGSVRQRRVAQNRYLKIEIWVLCIASICSISAGTYVCKLCASVCRTVRTKEKVRRYELKWSFFFPCISPTSCLFISRSFRRPVTRLRKQSWHAWPNDSCWQPFHVSVPSRSQFAAWPYG